MTEATAKRLTRLIREELERGSSADPHVIARGLMPRVPKAMRDDLAFYGLLDKVRAQITHERGDGDVRVAGPSRWRTVRPVYVGGTWKPLADCDVTDLELLAEQHRELAAANLARAQEYAGLAEQLRASGCATVGDLWTREEKALVAA